MSTITAKLNAIADRASQLTDRDAAHRVSRTLRSLAVQAAASPWLPRDAAGRLRDLADYEAIRWPSSAVALWREAADAADAL